MTNEVKVTSAVVKTVFENFIQELKQAAVDPPAIERLQAALDEGQASVDKLRNALFVEDPLP